MLLSFLASCCIFLPHLPQQVRQMSSYVIPVLNSQNVYGENPSILAYFSPFVRVVPALLILLWQGL